VGEGWVTAGEEGEAPHPGVGVGTPRSGEEEGEGGDNFYTARSGNCAELLAILGRGGGVKRELKTAAVVLEPRVVR